MSNMILGSWMIIGYDIMRVRDEKSIAKHFYKRSLLKDEGTDNRVLGCRADVTLVTPKTERFFQDEDGFTLLSEHVINAFSPDRLDSRVFWREATRHFPWIPICSNERCSTPEQVNAGTWGCHSPLVYTLSDVVYAGNPEAKMLEIGPGYGGVMQYIKRKHGLDNYYCIDVNPLFEYERMFQTDGETIPEEIPDELDIVYSSNVFQHLSDRQRRSYIRQASQKLAIGGLFVFNLFVLNEQNRDQRIGDKKLFGNLDEKGNAYTCFFNQFTRIPQEDEIEDELNECGLKLLKKQTLSSNSAAFWATKV